MSFPNRKFVETFFPTIDVLKSGRGSVLIAICFSFPPCAISSFHSFSFHASCSLCIDASNRKMASLQYCAVDNVALVLTTNCHASYLTLVSRPRLWCYEALSALAEGVVAFPWSIGSVQDEMRLTSPLVRLKRRSGSPVLDASSSMMGVRRLTLTYLRSDT